jgi:hypothetical protein
MQVQKILGEIKQWKEWVRKQKETTEYIIRINNLGVPGQSATSTVLA